MCQQHEQTGSHNRANRDRFQFQRNQIALLNIQVWYLHLHTWFNGWKLSNFISVRKEHVSQMHGASSDPSKGLP